MKYSYVARQPILDREKRTIGYELLFRDGPKNTFPEVEPEQATSRLLSDHFLSTHYNTLGNKLGFVNFPQQSLINLVPTLFPKDSLVIEVLEDCEPTEELLKAIKYLHECGYKIALDDFVPTKAWKRFLPYVSIIKFDIRLVPIEKAAIFIQTLRHYNIEFLAEKVETYEEFKQTLEAGFTYFQGYFFSKPEMIKKKQLKPSFLAVIQLCKEIADKPINFDEVERLFSIDITLSYKLLTYVNSGYTLATKIKSFRQALIYLGEDRLRRFISLVAIASVQDDKPDSLYTLAIQRARMCELLLSLMKTKYDPGQAFLTGMFSLLDSLLDQPLSDVINDIPVDDDIKLALTSHKGVLGYLLSMTIAYEQANWERVEKYCAALKLTEEQLVETFNQSTVWAQELLSQSS
ncbi:EAL domain-containing protein [Vibrio sp. J1-1]|uniref:EAL and HDOD domain-containing protein n=1 Tax=Vibrio sp. J1-1 TaxID=2912251 RepID=UPI001F32B256|nr:EAL domain-containing protein [Vibrio sp. J1-1]MBR9875444.1 EAL domain-containing protein [Vibrionaceae bacterium]MCF7481710.1 EAL domain-containing protein [Vibrio sp. J1-1]